MTPVTRIKFFFIVLLSSTAVFSQSPDYELFTQPSLRNDSGERKIFFKIENLNFFKNNEYFNKITEGHTYIGYFLRPSFSYQPGSNTAIQAGVHLLKYAGMNGFAQALPYFRFQYRMLPCLELVMGNIYSTLNHRMIEPIYGFDRYLEQNTESGIQFLCHTSRYKGDVWLNWHKFIEYHDANKEQFSSGYTSELILTKTEEPLKIAVPVQFLFFHKGGQNTLDTSHLITRFNGAAGLSAQYIPSSSHFIRSIGIYGYGVYFKDLSPTPNIDFTEGNGIYANAFVTTSWVNVTCGYWRGYCFFNPMGDRMFSNISVTFPTYDAHRLAIPPRYTEKERAYLLSKVFIHHTIQKGIQLAAAFESYYDYLTPHFDMYYSLYVLCNLDFFLYQCKQ